MPGRSVTGRRLALAVAAGGAAAGITVQRRHLRAIAGDPVYARLRNPPPGEPLEVHSADGTRLHAEAFNPDGEGPLLVLAHGWTEQLSIWGPVIAVLTQAGRRVVAFDLRGHGASGLSAGDDYGLDRFGEDVEAVLAAATPDGERAVIVGHSLGAMAIAAWARDHAVTERAQGAALVNTGLVDLLTGHLLFGQVAARFNSRLAGRIALGVAAPLPAFSTPVAHAVIRHAAFGPTADTAQIAVYERMLMSTPPHVRAACGRAMSDMDLIDALARLDVPTLVVAGDRDRLTPPAQAERIASELPRPAGLITLRDTGHMSPLERPRELAAALGDLIAGLPPTAAPALAE